MVLRRSIKAVLVLVVVSIMVAIVSSFLTRSRNLPEAPQNDLLPENVESRGTNFDHSEFKLGRVVFRVRSDTDTVSDQGERLLKDVELQVFGEDGQVADAVTGKEATYWLDEKRIELRKEVNIRLSDGTEIFSDRLEADLEGEVIHIRDGFTFRRGDARGSGVALNYHTSTRRLTAGREFQMLLPASNGPLSVLSKSLEYDLNEGVMRLDEQVRIEGPKDRLWGQSVLIKLTPEKRIQSLVAVGQAGFTSPPHEFSGEQISMSFDEAGKGVTEFRIESGPTLQGGARVRARYRKVVAEGDHIVDSDRIDVVPLPGASSTSDLRLKSFEAFGDVRFRSSVHSVFESGSDRLSGDFRESGHLKEVVLAGRVKLNQRFQGAPRQSLQAPLVVCSFQGESLSETRATGPVLLEIEGEKARRTLQAANWVTTSFQLGKPAQLEARGNVNLRIVEGELKSTLQAPELTAGFQAGLLDHLTAGTGVQLSSSDLQTSRTSESHSLEAWFQAGLLHEIVQQGEFRLVERTLAGTTQLESGEALFRVAGGELKTSGPGRGRLTQHGQAGEEPLVTQAMTFRLLQRDRSVVAEGLVESELADPDAQQPVRISSQRMQASESEDWVIYDGGLPLLRTERSQVTGQEIRVHRSDRLMVVEGAVDSRLKQPDGEGTEEYHIQSRRLDVDRSSGQALYTGQVRALKDGMLLKAPFVQLLMVAERNDRVREVWAWGGVVIEEPSRRATGERCFYFPEENLVRLLGNPAQVTDAKQGKASGPRLLFYPGKEELIIESTPEKAP